MAGRISTDAPIAEITLRKYEKPYDISKRELVRRLCLSLGLLQPGDSRDIIVDIIYCFLESKGEDRSLSSEGIREWVVTYRKQERMSLSGSASSNIRRQIKRLRDLFLVEKVANMYRMNENLTLSEIFDEKIKGMYLNSICTRVGEYLSQVDQYFFKKI